MSYNIHYVHNFKRSLKRLAKKYKSIKDDLFNLSESIRINPLQGDELIPGVRKIRMTITSKGRGKSGGARVITYNILLKEQEGDIYFIDIYDKSEYTTVDESILKSIIAELNL